MHNTEIGIFKIAQTRVNWKEVAEWLDFIGVKDVLTAKQNSGWREIEISDYDVPDIETSDSDAVSLISLCGKRCYASFEVNRELNPNITKIRSDLAEYVTNILKSGHGSVLEHATWSFAIENVSRVFTGEMNRHRAGVAISEASMRYIRFDDIGFTMPSSLLADSINTPTDAIEASNPESEARKKSQTRDVVSDAFGTMQKYYIDLCNIWKIEEMTDFTEKKKLTSMFRRIIGMGVSTGGVWTMNARALRHILAMRGSVHAEEEIYDVFDRIAEIMINDEPLLFGDFTKDISGSWVPKYPKI